MPKGKECRLFWIFDTRNITKKYVGCRKGVSNGNQSSRYFLTVIREQSITKAAEVLQLVDKTEKELIEQDEHIPL